MGTEKMINALEKAHEFLQVMPKLRACNPRGFDDCINMDAVKGLEHLIEQALEENINETDKHFYFMGILQGHNGIPEDSEAELLFQDVKRKFIEEGNKLATKKKTYVR